MRTASRLLWSAVVLSLASAAWGATPTHYASRPAFLAALGVSVTDGYGTPPYPAGFGIYDNATFSAFFNETDYETTGFANWNFHLDDDTYCAGCNGSYRLIFTSTSLTVGGVGVFGFGLDVLSHGAGSNGNYVAYVAYGDGTFENVTVPAAPGFLGVTAPELIASVHIGLADGGARTDGSIVIDNLTLGAGDGCTLTCPADVVTSTAPGQCDAAVAYSSPTVAGTCGVVTCLPASGSTFALGTTAVNCTSELGAGACDFDVTVEDTEPPVLVCPADVAVAAPPGALSAPVDFTVPIATDNCSPDGAATCVPDSGETFTLGTTSVVCSSSDASGNASACAFDVTVGNQTVQEIPTASTLGLAGLALLLAGAALFLLRRGG